MKIKIATIEAFHEVLKWACEDKKDGYGILAEHTLNGFVEEPYRVEILVNYFEKPPGTTPLSSKNLFEFGYSGDLEYL